MFNFKIRFYNEKKLLVTSRLAVTILAIITLFVACNNDEDGRDVAEKLELKRYNKCQRTYNRYNERSSYG